MNKRITTIALVMLTALIGLLPLCPSALAQTLAKDSKATAALAGAGRSTTSQCVLTYTMLSGNGSDEGKTRGSNMRIRDTFWGMGNGTWSLGPGSLTVRLPSDGGQKPVSGKAEILDYYLVLNFTTDSGVTVKNRIRARARHPKDSSRAVATGHLSMLPRPHIKWLPCTYPSGYDEDEESYTPDVIAYGPGCLAPYHSVGNVNCDGILCGAGDLEDGDNPQDDVWEQKMKTFRLAPDLSRFWMDFMLVPNRMPSRTYVNLEGRLKSIECE